MAPPRQPERGTDAVLERLVEAIGCHVYIAEITGGEYREIFTGPGLEAFIGGTPPPGMSVDDAWPDRVHPDDYATYRAAMDRIHVGEPEDVEYRMIGFDGVVRTVWERCRPRRADGRVLVDGVALDVTDRQRTTRELEETRAHLERIVGSLDEHLYTAEFLADGSYREVYTGPGSERFLGVVPDGVDPVGAWDRAIHREDAEWVARVYSARERGEANEVTYRLIGFDGVTRWVSDRAYPRRTADGRLMIDGIVTDVTDQKEAERELHAALVNLEAARAEADQRSRIDELTGTYNRSHLAESIGAELDRALREGSTPGFVLIDLDHFKRVNDVYGHLSGDAVLVQAAARLRRSVRPYDTVARWGGEEFAVLVPGVANDEALRAIAEHLRRSIEAEPFDVDGGLLAITASVGAIRAGGDCWRPDALVEGADRALYYAKRRGRNRAQLESDVGALDHVDLDEGLRAIAASLALAGAIRRGDPAGLPEGRAELAEAIAACLGLDDGAVMRCRLGALLLDVGDDPVAGEQQLRRISGLQDVAPMIRHQAERIDGTGSPDGLVGDAIPIAARIAAVAAAYVGAGGDDRALAALQREEGAAFDPVVVNALTAVVAATR